MENNTESHYGYYWINNQIVRAGNYSESLLDLPNEGYKDFINVPSFDPSCDYRPFGVFVPNDSFRVLGLYWNAIDPKDIPKEFLTQLLLLGVNTDGS